MRRRFFTPFMVVISLLTSCNNRPLRSDIAEFIASFSIVESRKNYLESGYERVDISLEESGEIKAIEKVDFNIKELENITYNYEYNKYVNDTLTETTHRYVEKINDTYFYVDGEEKVEKTSEQIISQYVTTFFYKSSVAELYYLGMYAGDFMIEVINNIQDFVTIDKEKNEMIYDVHSDESEDIPGFEYEEVWIIDSYGMTKSCYMYSTNGKVEMTTNITVYNVI